MDEPDKIIVSQPSYFAALDSLLTSADLGKLKKYLAAQFISDYCTVLGEDYYDAYFDFFRKTMAGREGEAAEMETFSRRCKHPASGSCRETIRAGIFPQESKDAMLKMIADIRSALGEHIDSLAWMSDSTKIVAKEKLEAITVKVGFPDKWKDYSPSSSTLP